jgi:integrase
VSDGVRKWEWQIGQPKSRKSNRRVAVPEAALELLRRHRAEAKDPSGLVFLGPDGKRMDLNYFDEFIFGRISAQAGLPNVRFHDLRHFFASMLIAQGESAKYVCDQMGHSSIQVTSTRTATFSRTRVKQQQRSCNRRCSQEEKMGLVAIW